MNDDLEANVLLVDDEEDFLETLTARLEARGLKVNSVTRGEEAVSIAGEQNYDAIVVDLAMPGIDGIETIKRIKKKHPDMQIIMLTGQATVKKSIEAMKHGAVDLLEKPVDLKVLLEKIGKAKHKRMLVLEKKSQKEVRKILKSKSW